MNDDKPAGFLARWSRQKLKTQSDPATGPDRPSPPALERTPSVVHEAGHAAESAAAKQDPTADPTPPSPAPTWEELSTLTPDSDFRRFVSAGVDPHLRNAALKTLFKDPHFNVMDGLDVYIEDYGKPDPLPAGMLEQLAQSEALGLRPKPDAQPDAPPESNAPAPNRAESGGGSSSPSPLDPPIDPPTGPTASPDHEDSDLRLQSDDPDRRPRAASGPVLDAGNER